MGDFLLGEWLPAIKSAIKATTWANWNVMARTYVVPGIGDAILRRLTAPQLQAFYGHLLTSGRAKADRGPTMFDAWRRGRDEGKEPTARQLAAATGASIHVARKALPRFRSGWVPPGRAPGLEPKTVRNVHVMLHKALTDAVAWGYVAENVADQAKPPKLSRRPPTVWTPGSNG